MLNYKSRLIIALIAVFLAASVGIAIRHAKRNPSSDMSMPDADSADALNAALPPGHPAINGLGRIDAPPLDERALANGKASDCPFLTGLATKDTKVAVARKGTDFTSLQRYVLEPTQTSGQGASQ